MRSPSGLFRGADATDPTVTRDRVGAPPDGREKVSRDPSRPAALDHSGPGARPPGAGRHLGRDLGPVPVVVVAVLLAAAVLAAVHHAEVVAHAVGEPYGSLVLAVAVTVIEVGLIVTLMVSGKEGAATLARTRSSRRR